MNTLTRDQLRGVFCRANAAGVAAPGVGERQEVVPQERRISQQPRVRQRKMAAARHQRLLEQRIEEEVDPMEEDRAPGAENQAPGESPPHKRPELEIREEYQGKRLPDANRRWVVLPRWSKEALVEGNQEVLAACKRAQAVAAAVEGSASSSGASHAATTSQEQNEKYHHHYHQHVVQKPVQPAQGWGVGSMSPMFPLQLLGAGIAPPLRQFTFLPGLPAHHPSRQPHPPAPQ